MMTPPVSLAAVSTASLTNSSVASGNTELKVDVGPATDVSWHNTDVQMTAAPPQNVRSALRTPSRPRQPLQLISDRPVDTAKPKSLFSKIVLAAGFTVGILGTLAGFGSMALLGPVGLAVGVGFALVGAIIVGIGNKMS